MLILKTAVSQHDILFGHFLSKESLYLASSASILSLSVFDFIYFYTFSFSLACFLI
jgi:hypothetical protein